MRTKTILALAVGAVFGASVPNLYAQDTQPGAQETVSSQRSFESERRVDRQDWRGAGLSREIRGDLREIRQDRAEIRQDLREIAQDRAEILADRQQVLSSQRELARDIQSRDHNIHQLQVARQNGDDSAAARERREIRASNAEIRKDRAELRDARTELRADVRELHRDQRELAADRAELRNDRRELRADLRDSDRNRTGFREARFDRDERHDRGLHLGWERGQHRGWDHANRGNAPHKSLEVSGDRRDVIANRGVHRRDRTEAAATRTSGTTDKATAAAKKALVR